MKEILMSSEHFGFGLSIFIYLLAIQIKLRLKWDFLNPLLVSTIISGNPPGYGNSLCQVWTNVRGL